MKKLAVLALTSIIAASFSAVVLAENEPVSVVKGTAVFDGKIDEFIKAGAQPIKLAGQAMLKDAQDLRDDKDLSGVVYLMYDDKFLYMGADITDDVVTFNKSGSDVWNQDCIELWVDGFQFGISVDGATNEPWIQDWKGSGVTGENAIVTKAGGYVMEAKLSLADLAGAGVATTKGGNFQVAVGLDDADDGDRHAQLYFPTSWVHSTPDTFATATLK